MNKLFRVDYNEADWTEDDSLLISAKDLEECKQIAINHDWHSCTYNDDNLARLRKCIKEFKEEDLNELDYDAIVNIFEVENKSRILHISNKGA